MKEKTDRKLKQRKNLNFQWKNQEAHKGGGFTNYRRIGMIQRIQRQFAL